MIHIIDILRIHCIYFNIIRFLRDKDCNQLLRVCKQINLLLNYNGFAKQLTIECKSLKDVMTSHQRYDQHFRTLNCIITNNEVDPFLTFPQIKKKFKVETIVSICKQIQYSPSIKYLKTITFIECDNIDMLQLSLLPNLEILSIYNNQCNTIQCSRRCIFPSLKKLFISGDAYLKNVVSDTCEDIYLSGYLDSMNTRDLSNFSQLKHIFVNFVQIKYQIKTRLNIKFCAIIYDQTLYFNYFSDTELDNYIDYFLSNCNDSYNNMKNSIKTKIKNETYFLFI